MSPEEILYLLKLSDSIISFFISNALKVLRSSCKNPFRQEAGDIMSICYHIDFDSVDVGIKLNHELNVIDVCALNFNSKK